jgi:integrase/recombinase XerD
MSDLHTAAREYLAIRRALGFKLRGHDRLIDDLITFLTDAGMSTITTVAAVEWATRPDHLQPVRYAQRLGVIRGFANYLRTIDPAVQVPPTDVLSYHRWRRNPYLYSQADIEALLAATSQLRRALRAATFRSFFGLLAVTGMRVGEAIALDNADVDLNGGRLAIRLAKFGKHRDLPLHPSTVAVLRDYTEARDRLCTWPRGAGFFVTVHGTRLNYPGVRLTFADLLTRAGIQAPAETAAPTIHGLRHSFAVATLRDWYRAGVDVSVKLPILSAYLGHAHPASTYWYLSAASDLLVSAAHRLEQSTGDLR